MSVDGPRPGRALRPSRLGLIAAGLGLCVGLGTLSAPPVSASTAASPPPRGHTGLIKSSGSPVVHEERIGQGLAYAELGDGTKVLARIGSEVVVRSAVGAMEDGRRGRKTELTVLPPAESAATPAEAVTQHVAHEDAITAAIEKGVVPAEVASKWDYIKPSSPDEVSTQAHYSGGTFFDSGCAGAENSTGKIYGCYERYRSSQDWYTMGVRHWGTAEKKWTWTLTRARTGSNWEAGTGQLRQWRPGGEVNNNCNDYTFSGEYRGLSLSVTGPVCADSIGPEVSSTGKWFNARWKGWAWSPRETRGDHWYSYTGSSSGFSYRVGFFAV